jgi:hypothetical protein
MKSNGQKKQQEQSPKKQKKEEKIDWKEMMGMSRPTYKRHKGAMRQK